MFKSTQTIPSFYSNKNMIVLSINTKIIMILNKYLFSFVQIT